MTLAQLRSLLSALQDTGEIAVRAADPPDPLLDAWRDAHVDAEHAMEDWRALGGGDLYARYRAAQDREDAAQDAAAAVAWA
jgi:hypothetical protein